VKNRRGRAQKRYQAERDHTQAVMFDDPDEATTTPLDGELARDIHRMTLETSSNVYAQRRSTW
jgi:hypothetical protein